MDDYAGRVLADRYRLPLPPSDGYELVVTRAFDTYSGQEVLVRQVPLPEVVDAEVLDADGLPSAARRSTGRAVRRPTDPAVRRAIEAAQAAAQVPDHPRLDQVFDVFAEAGSLWIVSELVAARPLAALLAERPLNPYRAAEIGSDVLTALRVLHAHGWTHRNITTRTVLVCDDGRVVLTGLAAGAAEEALCGYVPAPRPDEENSYGPPAVESGPTGPYEPPEPQDPHESYEPLELAGPQESFGPPEPFGPQESYASYAPPGLPGPQRLATPYELPELPSPYERSEAYGALGPLDPPGSYGARVSGEPTTDAYGPHGTGEPSDSHEPDRRDAYGQPGAYEPRDPDDDHDPSGPPTSYGPPEPRAAAGPEALPAPRPSTGVMPAPARSAEAEVAPPSLPAAPGAGSPAQLRAARAGAIAAYRAGARAAARAGEDQKRADRERGTGAAPDEREETGALPGAEWDHDEPAPGPSPAPGLPRLTGGWGQAADDPYPYEDTDDDGDDDDDDEGPGPSGRRVHLAGTWDDGPGSGRPVPAGGSSGSGGYGEDALRADARRLGSGPAERTDRLPRPVTAGAPAAGWDEVVAEGSTPAYRGPATPLAAERARQARIAVVGAVTERWAPEQAGPVHDNWQLAPPIGPSTDLWALGALLYRAVQGHAPYPEENAAELVQMVCGEPPAFAEECGPLRPVVESLLRQDPTERPDFEELRGWLRSLVRSAPEPEAGADVVTLPPADATRLPVVRRRGELVRRRRGRGATHGRHRQGRPQHQDEPRRYEKPPRRPREPKGPKVLRQPPPGGRPPRRLGRLLLVLILLVMAAAVAYAMLFMPKDGSGTGAAPSDSAAPAGRETAGGPTASAGPSDSAGSSGSSGSSGSQKPQTSGSAVALASGYELRKDTEGFEIGVPKGWQRSPANSDRQILYGSDGFSVLIVPGRDTVKANGSDPLDYQRTGEPELKPFRESSWATSTGLRRVDVGRQVMAEGQFTWQEGSGRQVYVRNLVMIVDGRYHIVQVIGPENDRDKVSEIYGQAISSYRAGS
ncbi:protein kinase [Streptomyces sp. NPDC006289]|uniref:protein kinase n=1 Tax=Streptomyces sp. NPDC006289 TaxID=3156744 RepID=UPI0033ACDC7E